MNMQRDLEHQKALKFFLSLAGFKVLPSITVVLFKFVVMLEIKKLSPFILRELNVFSKCIICILFYRDNRSRCFRVFIVVEH